VAASPGFVENAQRAGVLQKAAAEVIKRRTEDPAAEAIRHLPAASAAYQQFSQALQSNDPAAIAQGARAWAGVSRETQTQMGIAEPQIVPKAYSEMVSGNVRKLIGEGKMQQAHEQIQQQMDLWGNDWPSVYKQLIQSGLPGTMLVVGAMNKPDQRQAAAQLTQAQATGEKSFKELLGDRAKEVKDGVEEKMRPFTQTFAFNPNSAPTSQAVQESVKLLAYQYTAQGDTPKAALDRAYQDIVGKKFHPVSGQSYRIPIEQDRSAVETGMRQLLSRIGDFEFDPPRSWLPGLTQEDIQAQRAIHLKSYGRFITSANGDGVYLIDQRGIPMSANGAPVVFQWEKLAGMAAAQPAPGVTTGAPIASDQEGRPQIGPGSLMPQLELDQRGLPGGLQ